LWVALGVRVMILLVGAPLTIAWVTGGPPPPRLEGLSPDAAKTILEQYRQLVQIHEETARARFDEIVLKALLPILTLVPGYVLGSQQESPAPIPGRSGFFHPLTRVLPVCYRP
jgi:hypothetical protein